MSNSEFIFLFSFWIKLFVAGFAETNANVPNSDTKVTNITACLLIERGNSHLLYDYDKSAAAIDLAVSYVNENIFPQNLHLQTIYSDIGNSCSGKNQILQFAFELWQSGVDCAVYIGPGCGIAAENLYNFAEYLITPIIGCPAADVGILAPSSDYPLLSRISISFSITAKVLLQFFGKFNYKNLVFFEDTNDLFYYPMSNIFGITMALLNPELRYTSKTIQFDGSASEADDYQNMLIQAQQISRVYTIFGNSRVVRNFMVFLAVALFENPEWGNFSWEMGDSSDSAAFQAYQTLAILSLEDSISSSIDDFEQQIVKKSLHDYNYIYPVSTGPLNPIVTHFYDAIILFGSAISDLKQNGIDYRNSEVTFGNLINNYSFFSPLNGKVQLDENGDREMSYVLKSMDPTTGKYQVALGFPPDGTVETLGTTLNWPNRASGLPPDIPECGLKNNMCKPKVHIMTKGEKAGIAIGTLLLLTILFLIGYHAKRYLNRLSDPYWWKIFESDLYLPGVNGAASGKSLAGTFASSVHSNSQSKISEDPETTLPVDDAEGNDETDVNKLEKTKLAFFNGSTVSLQELSEPKIRAGQSLVNEAALVRRLQHVNLQKIIGIAINDDNLCDYIVGEECHKGSITDLIQSDSAGMDWPFKHSLIKDIAAGMAYLHTTPITSSGWLTSHSCLINSRLVVKISDYGFTHFRREEDLDPPYPENTDRDFELLLWRAPELLRRTMPHRGSQVRLRLTEVKPACPEILYRTAIGDVYSFGILLQQIFIRSMPFRTVRHKKNDGESFKAMEITMEVKKGATPPMRPRVAVSAVDGELYQLMESCWEESPLSRPTFPRIRLLFRAIVGRSGDNIVDHLVQSLDRQSRDMEQKVELQTKLYLDEKNRSDYLLGQLLPKVIATALARGESILPRIFQSVTVQVSDIGDFSEIIYGLSPVEIVNLLNNLYGVIDGIIETCDACRIGSFADAIMTVSGIPVPNGGRHAFEICLLAITMRREIGKIVVGTAKDNRKLRFRSGIHSGPCIAAIVGLKAPKYCIFGETIHTAVQLKVTGADNKVHVSDVTKQFLDKIGGFPISERGLTELKGKGWIMTYWLLGND